MKNTFIMKYHHSGSDRLNGKAHIHEADFELMHILSGDGMMMIKDRLYPIAPNTLFFINAKDPHYSVPQASSAFIRNKFIFSKDWLLTLSKDLGCEALISSFFANGGCAVKLTADSARKIDECFLKLSEIVDTDEEIMAVRLFVTIFSILDIAARNKSKSFPTIKNNVSEIIEYINNNLDSRMTLDIIASEVKVSKYYLCHSFSSVVGMTVFEYILFVRIAKAKEMLAETSYSISSISSAVGFDNFAYFSKVFKEHEKITPRQFRKNARLQRIGV